ncbi:MAG: ATP-binding protein [Deltaproteobacteria bacterium]|jgi:serine/threonine-protein kinase RsbW|nr:ATP-binding protein [Deltaproteobacteria bacterium]
MTPASNEYSIEISLPSKIGYERIAIASSAALAKMGGFPAARIEDLKSAVAEACINAMQHGNQWRLEARVVVHMNLGDDRIVVSVTDQGSGVTEFPKYPGITKIIEENVSPRGLGVFIIHQLADEVRYNQTVDGGHTMTIEIRLPE